MNSKKTISIGFVVILLTSFAAALLPTAKAGPYDWFKVIPQPPEVYLDNSTNRVNQLFQINVTFSAHSLYGFEFKLAWKKTLLQCTARTLIVPTAWYNEYGDNYTITKNIITSNTTHYWSWVAMSALAPAPAFTGNWTIMKYTMKVLVHPELPDPNGVTEFKFFDDKMSDDLVQPIDHSVYDGYYEIQARVPPPPPTPYLDVVDPETILSPGGNDGTPLDDEFNDGLPPPMGLGEHFNASICIFDLVRTHDLWGWQASLSYNTTHLKFIKAYEGSFLNDSAGGNGTWFHCWSYTGYITVVGLFLGAHTKPESPEYGAPPPYNPGGVLALVEFEIIYMTNGTSESSPLTLFDTKLADTDTYPPPNGIPHMVSEPAVYYTPYKVLGRDIDCFTDPYRKYGYKHYTGYIGRGHDQNADAYEPQDWVILYALVTYNEDPVQNKYVAYEITPMDKYTGETREVEGFPLFRTAMTNASGIATVKFNIPWPCTDPTRVLGGFKCVQKVDVASTTINDTLWFEVGWIIKLTGVSVVNAKKCTFANVTITYENIAIGPFYDSAPPIYEDSPCGPKYYFRGFDYDKQQPPREWKRTLFTVVLYDDLGVPIGQATETIDVPTGYWCHPKEGSWTFRIHIPKWAFLGIGTVYVNAFTDPPSLCGIPYCPEISITFTISKQ